MQVKPDTCGAVCLRVCVYEQRFEFKYSQARGQIDRGCCFTNAAFLIRHPDNSCHNPYRFEMICFFCGTLFPARSGESTKLPLLFASSGVKIQTWRPSSEKYHIVLTCTCMYLIISGTNRKDSFTLRIAEFYQTLLKERSI